jgi:4-hydroxy-3-polyprenylbenzoate decarboxylase
MEQGRHGRLHMQRAFERGEPFPVVITAGQHPLLFLCACTNFLGGPEHGNEFEIAGAVRGEPIEMIEGEATGLPFPAYAEIAIEAIARPGMTHPEGPFAEFTGYYASATRNEPMFEIQRIYHRNDPIILGDAPPNPQHGTARSFGFFLSGQIWDVIDAAGVPSVKAIVSHAASGGGQFVVIQIKQEYPGHAKQAAGVVAMSRSTGNAARYIVVVDDDINPYDLGSVIWAISNRADPGRDIDLIHDTVGSPLDPLLPPDAKERGEFLRTKAIINACRPYEWKDRFPPVNEMSAELRDRLTEKWGATIRGETNGRAPLVVGTHETADG